MNASSRTPRGSRGQRWRASSARADGTRHQGDFRKIVEGVNDTLDAVHGPINEAAQVLEKLAQRDLRARVTGSYQGDHASIKEALNATGAGAARRAWRRWRRR